MMDKVVEPPRRNRREPCNALPPGWTRLASRRERGASIGKLDVYYHNPAGRKIRSKAELTKELGDTWDLTNFDFMSGKIVTSLIKGSRRKDSKSSNKNATAAPVISDLNSLVPPIRQTASIFKQPVTVMKTHKGDVRKNLKTDKDKPRQLFWEKRLNNISPYHEGEDSDFTMSLPDIVKDLNCTGGSENNATVLASLSTALHLDKKPVVGQKISERLKVNPVAYLNPDQPIVDEIQVTDDLIRQQEKRVLQARNKLAAAMKTLIHASG